MRQHGMLHTDIGQHLSHHVRLIIAQAGRSSHTVKARTSMSSGRAKPQKNPRAD